MEIYFLYLKPKKLSRQDTKFSSKFRAKKKEQVETKNYLKS